MVDFYGKFILISILLIFTSCQTRDERIKELRAKEEKTETRNSVIAIQPLGVVDQELISKVKASIEQTYLLKVQLLDEKQLPKSAFINVKSPRFRGDSLLKYLNRIKPRSVTKIIGITEKDISTTKRDANGDIKKPEYKYQDWGVFGLGYRPGSSSVISTFRVKNVEKVRFYNRMSKIAIHEVGHNYGLKHCPNKSCVMTDAVESVSTVDNAELSFCSVCRRKVEN